MDEKKFLHQHVSKSIILVNLWTCESSVFFLFGESTKPWTPSVDIGSSSLVVRYALCLHSRHLIYAWAKVGNIIWNKKTSQGQSPRKRLTVLTSAVESDASQRFEHKNSQISPIFAISDTRWLRGTDCNSRCRLGMCVQHSGILLGRSHSDTHLKQGRPLKCSLLGMTRLKRKFMGFWCSSDSSDV